MLTAQAKKSAEIWLGTDIPDQKAKDVRRDLEREMQNIVLIGMPGCGKSSIGKALQKMTGRRLIDTDELAESMSGKTVQGIIAQSGEETFRKLETEAIEQAGKQSGCIIATGGGCVTKDRNYPLLHQNGVIVWVRRDLNILPKDGRPLSNAATAEELYAQRRDLYAKFADITIDNDSTAEEAADRIIKRLSSEERL